MTTTPASCPGCGFVWEGVSRTEAIEGTKSSVAGFVVVIEDAGATALVRPEPGRWSIVEYAAHLRDVLLSLRERVVLASVLDTPTGQPIYRDERVDLGFYSLDSAGDAMTELSTAGRLFCRTLAVLPEGFEERPIRYSPVSDAVVTIGWVGAQGFHEASHHLLDARHNLEVMR